MRIAIIAAIAENGVIGRNGEIPWKLSADLRLFAALTKGGTLISGRKNHEAILKQLGHPLPGRRTLVLTRQTDYAVPEGCQVISSWETALEVAEKEDKVFVIGGAEVYALALPHAHLLHLTRLSRPYEGDTCFPPYDESEWNMIGSGFYRADDKNECDFSTFTYERRKSRDATPVSTR